MYEATPDRVAAARWYVKHVLPMWQELKLDPLAVEASLCILIEAKGGKSWIDSHPIVRFPPDPPMHCASMRLKEVMECSRVYSIVFKGEWIHISPETAKALIA